MKAAFCLSLISAAFAATHTPFGILPDECVRGVPSGTRLSAEQIDSMFPSHCGAAVRAALESTRNNTARKQRPAAAPVPYAPDYDGWLAYTTAKAPVATGWEEFYGEFTVPQAPSQYPDVAYLFTGLQNVDWIPIVDPQPDVFDIIQPVLQYPTGFLGGWSYKSWYVTLRAGAVYSDDVECDSGATLAANMTRVGGDEWVITTMVKGKPSTASTLTVQHPRLRVQMFAYNTFECYGCSDCAHEPSGTSHFSNLRLTAKAAGGATRPVTPSWTAYTSPNPKCNEKVVVQSDGAVDFTFQ
eukprot:TRINITY_DN56062_c0_g1_i1.p1 TRINITY_DN56062_c0_g1~~TRINITY_DN56062_c0_g1_i1.p1  ORF type:complete len:298 (+),score=49.60 TRINITY_DN56062_c0_g1_i1:74-967(+)